MTMINGSDGLIHSDFRQGYDLQNFTSFESTEGEDLTIYASKATARKFVLAFGVILIPTCSIFGSVGNVLSIIVLVHHRMRNPINFCLASLAVSDLLVLLHSFWFSITNIYAMFDPKLGHNLRVYTYPILGVYGSVVTARITSWLTTILSIERFIAVYFPIRAKTICNKTLTRISIAAIYIITAVSFIPLALKYEVLQTTDNRTNISLVILKPSAIGRDKRFGRIYGVTLNIVFRFIPIAMLIILNFAISCAIRKTWNIRRTMFNQGAHTKLAEQKRITRMLLAVSGVFLVCILPGSLNTIVSQVKSDYSRIGFNKNLYFCVASTTYFLETLNSSVNFIIYMLYSRKFSRTYKLLFCCCCDGPATRASTPQHEGERSYRRTVGSSTSNGSSQGLRITFVSKFQYRGTESTSSQRSKATCRDIELTDSLIPEMHSRSTANEAFVDKYN